MDDVASRARVSQMTVSRVLNNKGYVSDQVREAVMSAARELGYVQNRIAWSLRSEATSLIAVVLPTLNNRVFAEVLSGINAAAEGLDCQVAFGVSEYDLAREEALVRDFLAWRPRGMILAGLEHTDATVAALTASGAVVVEIMDTDGVPIETAIGLAQREAGRNMARYLLSRGHRRFAYAGSQARLDVRAAKRFDGFAETVRASGAELLSTDMSDTPSMLEGRRMTNEILSRAQRPDAIYFSNDDLAAGGLMHCLAERIAVPDTVAIAGFNGLSFLEALPLRITTTETPRYEIGQRAVDSLSPSSPRRSSPNVIDLGFRLIPGETS